eukprot:gnl/MRDRNA2_/MRDRNA2_90121_c0_seq1.p1 gnl/MRDRNA2_/MRDRNA2_90121_c0~~gnl/MRDRNA2_/MRDRNA2_90121_c0_seq1.p1  ORF type:complete len:208 (+),score=64.86 gnl/MRDRNA2_/MRDRNA2_90121_c0_seq1:89-712(+)
MAMSMVQLFLAASLVTSSATSVGTATIPVYPSDTDGVPAQGLIQMGDRLRRLFEGTEEEDSDSEDAENEFQKAKAAEKRGAEMPTAMLQSAKLNLHHVEGSSQPTASKPIGHAHAELARQVQIGQNGRIPGQHMMITPHVKQESASTNSLLEVAEIHEEMVGQEEKLQSVTLPEQAVKALDMGADQGVVMLQHADQIVQTGELFEEL